MSSTRTSRGKQTTARPVPLDVYEEVDTSVNRASIVPVPAGAGDVGLLSHKATCPSVRAAGVSVAVAMAVLVSGIAGSAAVTPQAPSRLVSLDLDLVLEQARSGLVVIPVAGQAWVFHLEPNPINVAVSYTHLTLPTNREV